MFEDKIDWAMHAKGMTLQSWNSLLRDEEYISDNKIFAISRFINRYRLPIFLTKYIDKLEIDCKNFDIAVVYFIKTKSRCKITVDFYRYMLVVEYEDAELLVRENLLDYEYNGEHKVVMDLRQKFLNEILIRYFSRVLSAMYKELRWYEK